MRLKPILFLMMLLPSVAWAGGFDFGIQAGAFSPTKALDDNDNGIVAGAHLKFKFATFGIKAEGFYVDSSGRYADTLGEEFGSADIDVESILAADFMFYPMGMGFFLQGGVHKLNIDVDNFDADVIDNDLGYQLGAGITLFDKLMIQGKIMYTPDVVKSDVAETLEGLDDENLVGYMVTVGWNF